MQGAVGARCDQCIEHYVNVPTHGYCDECVDVLLVSVQEMSQLIDGSEEKLKNLSTSQLYYEKLNKYNSSASFIRDSLLALTTYAAELLQDNVDKNNVSRKYEIRDVVIKATRLRDDSVLLKNNAGSLAQRGLAAYGKLLDLATELGSK
ncbi:unnamed protein product [Soboliphyme baturini]|uniref:Zf-TFIIB domain-containing protein n=1 Tax=Soboliphyme baturini TaxID=241478 RepID=A0A183JBD3_9BILA|nr:unnamed protein product [Soboliphyme baturini]